MGGGYNKQIPSTDLSKPLFTILNSILFCKSKPFILSIALAASLFPFKAYADRVDRTSGDCKDDPKCAYWSFSADGNAKFPNNTRIGVSHGYTYWARGGSAYSSLENFNGAINNMTLKGTSVQAPRLNFSGDTDSAKVVLDSDINADLFGTFYTMDVTNSNINGYITTFAGSKHNIETLNFDHSNVTGNIMNSMNNVDSAVKINFSNGSVFDGDIIINATSTFSTENSKTAGMWTSFTDSTWNGTFKDINADAWFVNHLSLTRTKVNADSDKPTDFTFINGRHYFDVTETNLNANVNIQSRFYGTFTNSSVGNINQMGGGTDSPLDHNTLKMTNSTAGNIKVTAGIIDITMDHSTLGVEGNQDAAIFDSGGWWGLTSSDSTINGYIYSDAYNSFSIKATNTTINGIDDPTYGKLAIANWYGTVSDDSFFDNSTINGSIIWINSSFGSKTTEGLSFKNNTVLNGNLARKDEVYGSSADPVQFNFSHSVMNGNITDYTTKDTNIYGSNNPVTRVMFRQSTLNGDISISSKNLNTAKPYLVDMGVGFYQSSFNFKNITVASDDSKNKPKLSLSLNETTMNGEDIKNQGDLTIVAGRNSHIKANITTGINDDGSKSNNASFNLHLNAKDLLINHGMTEANTDGSYKVNLPDDANKPSSYEGRLITSGLNEVSHVQANIWLDNGSVSLLSGSNATLYFGANTGTNSLSMQDTLLYMTRNSLFSGALNTQGYNRLTLDPNVNITLNAPSVFTGSLASVDLPSLSLAGKRSITINAKTTLLLKSNENSSNITDFQKPSTAWGFEGAIYDNTTGGNYLEMDSTQTVDNGIGGTDDTVALILDNGTKDKINTFKGTLFTKGSKNYLYLGSHSNFTLDAGSFFDGVLVNVNTTTFNNANGNVVLEEGSNFTGRLSANTLTLKGAYVSNAKDTTIKAIQVLSGDNTLELPANTTAPILNTGGNLYLSFSPTFDTGTDPISYKGGIYTYGGKTNIDFNQTLYADPNESTILAAGNAINNISYNSDMTTITKFLPLISQIPGQLPVYNIYTEDNAQNNFAISGPFSAKANIHYSGGHTTLILADSSSGALDIKNGGDSIDNDTINGHTYQDGLSINLDAQKADILLKKYRDLYPSNFASLSIDKLSSTQEALQEAACKADATKCLQDGDPKKISGFLTSDGTPIYKASLDGVLVGDISSLATSGSKTKKEYLAILNSNSAFIGSVDIQDVPISISLSEGAKVVFTKDSAIQTLQSSSSGIDMSSLTKATLSEKNNTIIDLATQANPDNVVKKTQYSTLSINHLDNVNNVVFKFSFGKDSAGNNASDRLIVTNTADSKYNLLQIYQNLSAPTELKAGEKVLIASVANGGSISGGKIFEAGEVINHEGFDVIKSNIIVLDQDSNDPNTAKSGATYSNYYLSSMSSSINPEAANLSKAALNSNRSILLSNINDLNKRLGELRDNPYAQGAWARVFNGMSSSDYGLAMTNVFTNVQAGYDYSVGNLKNANQYLGVAVSYGYNSLNASGANLKGSGNMIELGAYYSYVADSGLYTDSILKYAFINNKLTTDVQSTINYNTNAITFGQEVGYRFFLDKNKRFYIDPLAEITLGYFGGGHINQIKGEAFLNSEFDSSLLYRVKVGGNMGYKLITSRNETDFRAGLSYLLDGNAGNISMNSNLSSETSKIPLSNTGLLQLGVNSIISSNWRAYVDLDVGFGSKIFRQDYLISLGGRYIFGKKSKSTPLINNQPPKSHR